MSNELVITETAAKVVSSGCSEELSRLLTARDGNLALISITENRALRDEAVRMAPVLRERARGAGKAGVISALMPLTTVYGIGDKTDKEWETFWGQYIRALSDLPISSLMAAADAYNMRADSDRFPKPGPFRDLAIRHNAIGVAAARALAASRAEPQVNYSLEHRRQMLEKIKGLLDELKPAVKPPEFNPPPPVTDGQGLTPEMRSAMRRRSAA